MKKTIFALAALAALAMGCAKEQQPSDTPADQGKVTTIRVTVAQAKVAVDETTGACTWQEGDQLAVWYQNDEDNTAGKKVIFTYNGLLEDGSAEFTTTEDVAGNTAVRAAHPIGSIKDDGGFELVKKWTYDAERRPVYVRTENITTNPNGSLSAQLGHNASIFKFTLHDIPAYAAGFVLETKRYNEDGTFKDQIDIKTSFPYKTGYTADPADNSNDIDLYSVAPHSSYLSRIYLIDGDGEEIEGSEKKFKQSGNDVSNHDFIALPRVDFQKANLRKDYVKVCGIKWAKGNLQCYEDNGDAGFQDGWRIAPAQWHHFKYDLKEYTIGKNTYTYDDTKATEMQYEQSSTQFEHFNFGALARNSRFYSSPGTNYMVPGRELDISGKIYTDSAGNTEATGDDRFVDSGTFTSNNSAIWGDLAFWASKGKFRMPTKDEISVLYSSSKVYRQFGHYKVGDVKVWGVLFTSSLGEQGSNTNDVELTDADIESGLFLPKAGRRQVADSKTVITMRTQGLYRSSTARWTEEYTNHSTILQLKPTSLNYGYTVHKTEFTNATGGLIRPVLVEE